MFVPRPRAQECEAVTPLANVPQHNMDVRVILQHFSQCEKLSNSRILVHTGDSFQLVFFGYFQANHGHLKIFPIVCVCVCVCVCAVCACLCLLNLHTKRR